jgi:acyl-coenzyme A synthetase/AMP-(fatty) acid ligase
VVLRGAGGEPEERVIDQLYDWCRAHLATKMVPRRILVVPSIPCGALGKIARAELRKLCRSEARALQPT